MSTELSFLSDTSAGSSPVRTPATASPAEPVLASLPPSRTKNAITASNGNKAEVLLCTQANVKTAFESYFGKPIASIVQIPGRKKADNRITFVDGTSVLCQNKNGKVEGRGHSVDRRKASLITDHTDLHTLLETVCLKKAGGEKPVLEKTVSEECVAHCLVGVEAEFRPDYFLHTNLDAAGTTILELAIVPAPVFLMSVQGSLFPVMDAKRTCVHLSPHLYFQRKGGGESDHAPDDIQLKMRFRPGATKAIPDPMDLTTLFVALPL